MMFGRIPKAVRPVAQAFHRSVHVEAKLAKLGLELPTPKPPLGSFSLCSRSGNMLYTAGHLPLDVAGNLMTGKVSGSLHRSHQLVRITGLLSDLPRTSQIIPSPNNTPQVGQEVSEEEAHRAAQLVALNLIATLKKELGDLDRVKKVVKLLGFVNCVDSFSGQPGVINGASNMMGDVFGDKGVHSRSAVGTNSLPLNVPVEIEAIVEIEDV